MKTNFIEVSDGNLSDSKSFTLDVIAQPDPPEMLEIGMDMEAGFLAKCRDVEAGGFQPDHHSAGDDTGRQGICLGGVRGI